MADGVLCEFVVLCFDVDCDSGLEVDVEVILKDRNLCDQALDQCLVKLCDGGRLAFDEILQIPDLLHLFIFDDAVHLGLPALITEAENLICDGVVVCALVCFFQKLFLQIAQPGIDDLRGEGAAISDGGFHVGLQGFQKVVLLAEHLIDGVDYYLLQNGLIHCSAAAGVAGVLKP